MILKRNLLSFLRFLLLISCSLKHCLSLKASNVRTTFHGATEVGACQLPTQSYTTQYPVALGDISSLDNLRFDSNLCGHILTVNCGNGDVDVIVTNSNLSNAVLTCTLLHGMKQQIERCRARDGVVCKWHQRIFSLLMDTCATMPRVRPTTNGIVMWVSWMCKTSVWWVLSLMVLKECLNLMHPIFSLMDKESHICLWCLHFRMAQRIQLS